MFPYRSGRVFSPAAHQQHTGWAAKGAGAGAGNDGQGGEGEGREGEVEGESEGLEDNM